MSEENIEIRVSDKGISAAVASKLDKIAASATKSDSAIKLLNKNLQALDANSLTKLAKASNANVNALARETNALSRKTLAEARASEIGAKTLLVQQKKATELARTEIAQRRKIVTDNQIVAAENRASIAALRLADAQKRANRSFSSGYVSLIRYIKTIALYTGASLGVREIFQAADAFTVMQNKIKNVTNSQQELNVVSNRLIDIANRTRTDVTSTAQAFQRFDLALVQLGAGQDESLRMTETVNKALALSGAGVGEQSSALLQLSQAFNKGKLDGDEFRSVMELLPVAADAFAKELNVTRGQLLKLAPQGKITSEVMRRAFASIATEVDEKFGKTVPTVGQALVVLKNNFLKLMGGLEAKTGVFSTISNLILLFANNLHFLAGAALSVGVALAVAFGPKIWASIKKTTVLSRVFNSVLKANPIVLVASLLAAAATSLYYFRNQIKLSSDGLITLGDVFTGVMNYIIDKTEPTVDFFKDLWVGAVEIISKAFGKLANLLKLDILTNSTSDLAKSIRDASRERRDSEGEGLKLRGPSAPRVMTDPNKAAINRAKTLRKINSELDRELDLLNKVGIQSQIDARYSKIINDLAQKKIFLAEGEAKAIYFKIEELEKEKGIQTELAQIYDDVLGKKQKFIDRETALNRALEMGLLSKGAYGEELAKLSREFEKFELSQGTGTFADVLASGFSDLSEGYTGPLLEMQGAFTSFFASLRDGFANSIGRAVVYSENLSDSLKNLGKQALADLISQTVKMGITSVLWESQKQSAISRTNAAILSQGATTNAVLATTTAAQGAALATTTAASTSAAGATTAAWTPAAATTSIASFGASAAIGLAALIAALAATKGFKTGGYTGNLGVNETAGVVHGKEFVFDAGSTARLGVSQLEALRHGAATVVRSGEQVRSSGYTAQAPQASQGSNLNQKIINVLDPTIVGNYLDSSDSDDVFINKISRNSSIIREVIGV